MRMTAALALVAGSAASLAAHSPAAAAAGHAHATSPSVWDAGVMALLVAGAALYAIGSWRLRQRGARLRTVERASFWIGWAVLLAAVAPPLDRAAASLFSMHMAQHELLMLIGAPLMIVGRPIVPWLWALPARWRPVAGTGLQWRPVTYAWRWMTTPVIAWVLHGVAIWIWHLPSFYEAAVRNEALHAFQHATFVGTAVLFWWGLVYGRYGRAAYGASVLYVFTTMVHTGILGALFALSTSPFYGLYRERAAAAGVDPAIDQQLAGLYMWIPAGIVLTVSGLALLMAWMSEAERRARTARRGTIVVLAIAGGLVGGCGWIPDAREAQVLTGGDPYKGRERIVQYGCDSCHTIPGVATADAHVGPPLTGVARRTYLAGHLENTPENMRRWIEHPHTFDEKTAMPELGVSRSDSQDIVAYLFTLR